MKIALSSPAGPVTIELGNRRDHISRVIFKNQNWYEFDLLTDLTRRVKRGVAIDVGAHIGNHSLYMAAHGFKVVAFEPNPVSFEQLRVNVKANPNLWMDVVIHPRAVGREFGVGSVFSPNPVNSGMAYVEPATDGEEPDNSYVQIVPLDSLELDNVTVIKIDVEGHEIDVLEGARTTIEIHRPTLYIEASTEEARDRVDGFLQPLGYIRVGKFCKTPTYCYIPKPEAPTLSITIMAHPARKDMANALGGELGRQGVISPIVWDKINDRWDTGRRSMLAYDESMSHHLVIQDDAVIPPNFIELINEALQIPPADSPICLYAGRALLRKMTRPYPSWYTMPGVNWGVGIVVPTNVIEEMVEFGDGREEQNYDLRISRFFQSRNILTWYPIPSLVNHRRTPSLVAGRGSRRSAAAYVGAQGLQFDPHGRVAHLKWSR